LQQKLHLYFPRLPVTILAFAMQTAISFLRADFPARPTEIQNTQKIANFAPHKGIPAAKSFQLQGLPLTS